MVRHAHNRRFTTLVLPSFYRSHVTFPVSITLLNFLFVVISLRIPLCVSSLQLRRIEPPLPHRTVSSLSWECPAPQHAGRELRTRLLQDCTRRFAQHNVRMCPFRREEMRGATASLRELWICNPIDQPLA